MTSPTRPFPLSLALVTTLLLLFCARSTSALVSPGCGGRWSPARAAARPTDGKRGGGAGGAAAAAAARSPLFVLNALAPLRERDAGVSEDQIGGYAKRRRARGGRPGRHGPPSDGGAVRPIGPPDVDAMRARAGVLRMSIVRQQMELRELERQILCCTQTPATPLAEFLDGPARDSVQHLGRTWSTLTASTNVLLRKLGRVHAKAGPQNRRWSGVGEFVANQTQTGVRIVRGLVDNPERLAHLADPGTPTLVPHVPAILARLDRLEDHVAPILERVLNNRRHLASVEPYLDDILERFDDIEPHLPWILDNIDALAPYTGLLLKHIDELLLYADADADADAHEMYDGTKYDLAEQLLPYLEYYASRLDVVRPHLPLLRPHVPLLLKHDRIAKVSPHIDRLFARGYSDLSASANMDVLLFWFGWSLRIPGLPRLFFALPWSPRIVSFLANRMPKRFVRGYCSGVSCYVDDDYGSRWNKMEKA